MLRDEKLRLWSSVFSSRLFKPSGGFIQRFIRQHKSAPMYGYGLFGKHVQVNLKGLFRVDMVIAHKPPGLVGAYGYSR